jgi:hypothetical protein
MLPNRPIGKLAITASSRLLSQASRHRGLCQAASIFEPNDSHKQLREMARQFAKTEVDPQANVYNRDER